MALGNFLSDGQAQTGALLIFRCVGFVEAVKNVKKSCGMSSAISIRFMQSPSFCQDTRSLWQKDGKKAIIFSPSWHRADALRQYNMTIRKNTGGKLYEFQETAGYPGNRDAADKPDGYRLCR